ncbi:MAG: MFS transporter [Chloroflexota bacterium]
MTKEDAVTLGSTHNGFEAFRTLPWVQLRLIVVIPFLIMVAMLNFAPLLPQVREELGLSNTWVAFLTSATLLTHTFLQLLGGHITDSLGAKRSVTVGIGIAGVAVVASGLAPNLPLLLLSRLLLGVGTAMAFIAGLAFTNGLVSAEKRIPAQSIYGAAASAGVLTMLLFSERVADFGGWRVAFVAEGAAILVFGLLVASKQFVMGYAALLSG